jgi:hypothetical protein
MNYSASMQGFSFSVKSREGRNDSWSRELIFYCTRSRKYTNQSKASKTPRPNTKTQYAIVPERKCPCIPITIKCRKSDGIWMMLPKIVETNHVFSNKLEHKYHEPIPTSYLQGKKRIYFRRPTKNARR